VTSQTTKRFWIKFILGSWASTSPGQYFMFFLLLLVFPFHDPIPSILVFYNWLVAMRVETRTTSLKYFLADQSEGNLENFLSARKFIFCSVYLAYSVMSSYSLQHSPQKLRKKRTNSYNFFIYQSSLQLLWLLSLDLSLFLFAHWGMNLQFRCTI
jgi:hypothetical protein